MKIYVSGKRLGIWLDEGAPSSLNRVPGKSTLAMSATTSCNATNLDADSQKAAQAPALELRKVIRESKPAAAASGVT